MQERISLFSGVRSALPPGPGVVAGKARVGVLLLAGFVACAGAAGVLLHGKYQAHAGCAKAATEPVQAAVSQAQPRQPLTEAQRARLLVERARLIERIGAYEEAMERGEGCRVGFVKYRLELLRIDEQLSHCEYERAYLQRQIAHLEAMRARMLTGYGEMQGPAGHDE